MNEIDPYNIQVTATKAVNKSNPIDLQSEGEESPEKLDVVVTCEQSESKLISFLLFKFLSVLRSILI